MVDGDTEYPARRSINENSSNRANWGPERDTEKQRNITLIERTNGPTRVNTRTTTRPSFDRQVRLSPLPPTPPNLIIIQLKSPSNSQPCGVTPHKQRRNVPSGALLTPSDHSPHTQLPSLFLLTCSHTINTKGHSQDSVKVPSQITHEPPVTWDRSAGRLMDHLREPVHQLPGKHRYTTEESTYIQEQLLQALGPWIRMIKMLLAEKSPMFILIRAQSIKPLSWLRITHNLPPLHILSSVGSSGLYFLWITQV